MTDQLTFYTSVKPDLKWSSLMRGSFVAGTVTLALLLSAVYFSQTFLTVWGLPIMMVWIACLCWGMIPYRELVQLENAPNKLTLTSESLIFSLKGKDLLSIPLASVASLEHIDFPSTYGIGIRLLQPAPKPVVVHGTPKMMKAYYGKYRFDIFLPYFTKRAYGEIEGARAITLLTGEYHEV
jgi:hypothetical protein